MHLSEFHCTVGHVGQIVVRIILISVFVLQGIVKRDELVFHLARQNQVPIVMVTSGGYQRSNAKLIADSILNLHAKQLISPPP